MSSNRYERPPAEPTASDIFVNNIMQHQSGEGTGTDVVDDISELEGRDAQSLARTGGNEKTSLFHVNLLTPKLAGLVDMTAVESEPMEQNPNSNAVRSLKKTAVQSEPQYTVSKNQFLAIKKYPSLVEHLGTPEGDKLAQVMLAEVNVSIADKIEKNSKVASDFARTCKAERQNLQQYFVGEEEKWMCKVTASGPFRGDEAFFYNKDSDKSYIVRKVGEKWEDLSDDFNIVHEYVENKQ